MKYSVVLSALAATALAIDQEPVKQVDESNMQDRPRRSFKVEDNVPAQGIPEQEAYEPYPTPEEFTEAVLFEQFVGEPKELFAKWKTSSALKANSEEEFSYVGKWAIEEATVLQAFKGDKGLVLKTPAAHHAISRQFDRVLDNKDKTLVLQYDVKTQQGMNCGGAYVKLLSAEADLDTKEFSNETPYQIMFGPDKCGSTDKVHLILRRKNPNSGEYEEKHLVAPPRTRPGALSTLYTLIINPDQTYEIRINGVTAKAGSLLDENAFQPALNPPAEIEDPEDTKPEDWVDEDEIPDPEQAEKPEDWDEDAPLRIADPDAVKPEDWREDLEDYIPDPETDKPEDWDDEEDGEWVAPYVPNPECEDISGCGEWTAPMVRNPNYKGRWIQPTIPNPEYKGEWAPRTIPNPEYYEDARPSDLEPIGAIGLELWTMQADIVFNNFYIGHSVVEAEGIGNATWSPKYYVELKENAASAPEAAANTEQTLVDQILEDPVTFFSDMYNDFITQFRVDMGGAVRDQPLAAAVFAVVFFVISSIFFGIFNIIITLVTGHQLPNAERPRPSNKNEELRKATEIEGSSLPSSSTSAKASTGEARKRKD